MAVKPADRVRAVALVLVGVAGLVLKRHYGGPYPEIVWSYGGNVAASFAVYFIVSILPLPERFRSLSVAALALAVVEIFEATDGFGVMGNVYDRVDFAANAVGVGLALAVDTVVRGIASLRSGRSEGSAA